MCHGEMVQVDVRGESGVRRRIQACAFVWWNVEGVMADRKLTMELNRKVLCSRVTPVWGERAAVGIGEQLDRRT